MSPDTHPALVILTHHLRIARWEAGLDARFDACLHVQRAVAVPVMIAPEAPEHLSRGLVLVVQVVGDDQFGTMDVGQVSRLEPPDVRLGAFAILLPRGPRPVVHRFHRLRCGVSGRSVSGGCQRASRRSANLSPSPASFFFAAFSVEAPILRLASLAKRRRITALRGVRPP